MKLLFMGRKHYGAEALAWTVKEGWHVVGVLTDSHIEGSPTAKVAARHKIPLYTYEQLEEAVNNNEINFDVAVSYVFWRKIKSPIITHPQYGIINFHPAPLPDLRGTGGFNIAILENHPSFGVTAHYMDADIDTGPIIDVRRFEINAAEETAASLEKRSHNEMLELYKKTLMRVQVEKTLESQSLRGGRHFSRAEMEALKKIQDGDDIDTKARAFWFPPYDGAQVTLAGQSFTVVSRKILESIEGDPQALFTKTQTGK